MAVMTIRLVVFTVTAGFPAFTSSSSPSPPPLPLLSRLTPILLTFPILLTSPILPILPILPTLPTLPILPTSLFLDWTFVVGTDRIHSFHLKLCILFLPPPLSLVHLSLLASHTPHRKKPE